jgi:hypothetical protein
MDTSEEKSFSPIERAIWIAIIAGLFLTAYFIPESVARCNLCVFKMITGIDCPLCGMTGSIHCAARGDVHASLSHHPMGIVMLVTLITLVPCIARGKIHALFAKYLPLFFFSGLFACWLLKIIAL